MVSFRRILTSLRNKRINTLFVRTLLSSYLFLFVEFLQLISLLDIILPVLSWLKGAIQLPVLRSISFEEVTVIAVVSQLWRLPSFLRLCFVDNPTLPHQIR